jgi:HEAT repeat protein
MNRHATETFSSLAWGKTPSLSVLLEDLGSNRVAVRNFARHFLVEMGREAIPSLIRTLELGNVYARGQAARALGEIRDPSAAPALVKVLSDGKLSVHAMATEALIAMGKPAIPALLRALMEQPQSLWLRRAARMILLAETHKSWREQIQPLLDALDLADPDLSVPAAARRLLDVLAPNEVSP